MAFTIILLAALASCSSAAYVQQGNTYSLQSAASPSQIQYAESQNYDQTGPGAKSGPASSSPQPQLEYTQQPQQYSQQQQLYTSIPQGHSQIQEDQQIYSQIKLPQPQISYSHIQLPQSQPSYSHLQAQVQPIYSHVQAPQVPLAYSQPQGHAAYSYQSLRTSPQQHQQQQLSYSHQPQQAFAQAAPSFQYQTSAPKAVHYNALPQGSSVSPQYTFELKDALIGKQEYNPGFANLQVSQAPAKYTFQQPEVYASSPAKVFYPTPVPKTAFASQQPINAFLPNHGVKYSASIPQNYNFLH